jgi:hypothetical protein
MKVPNKKNFGQDVLKLLFLWRAAFREVLAKIANDGVVSSEFDESGHVPEAAW